MTSIAPEDVRGVVGILPTPSLPGADDPSAVDTVNLAESHRLADAIAASGVDVIMTNGTFGEASTLTREELFAFNDVVVAAVAGRVPVFAGATAMNTRDTIARGRELLALGADGLFVGRPFWLPLDQRQIVDYYRAIADALPGAPIVVYDNVGVFKGPISVEAYNALAEIPQLVAAKHVGVSPGDDSYVRAHAAVAGRMVLLPILDNWLPTRDAAGDVPAAWCGDVACGPEPALALRDAIQRGDRDAAERIHADLVWAAETLFPGGDFPKFMQYSIQIDRAEFAAAGYMDPGPARHPYVSAPKEYLDGGAETGRRLASLRARYA